jgi:hypothetical protein
MCEPESVSWGWLCLAGQGRFLPVILRDCDFFEVGCLGGWVEVEGKV